MNYVSPKVINSSLQAASRAVSPDSTSSPSAYRDDEHHCGTHSALVLFRFDCIIIIIIIIIITQSYSAHTSSVQLPLKQQAHGTAWPSNSFRRLADASQPSLKIPVKQCFCSSACPWPFNRGMRSPSKTQCPLNESPLQPFNAFL